MSIELYPRDWDDDKFDACGNRTQVVLIVNHIKIPLCEDCLTDLQNELKRFNETRFCKKCKHFKYDKWGENASCMAQEGMTDEDIGCSYCVDDYDTGKWCNYEKYAENGVKIINKATTFVLTKFFLISIEYTIKCIKDIWNSIKYKYFK